MPCQPHACHACHATPYPSQVQKSSPHPSLTTSDNPTRGTAKPHAQEKHHPSLAPPPVRILDNAYIHSTYGRYSKGRGRQPGARSRPSTIRVVKVQPARGVIGPFPAGHSFRFEPETRQTDRQSPPGDLGALAVAPFSRGVLTKGFFSRLALPSLRWCQTTDACLYYVCVGTYRAGVFLRGSRFGRQGERGRWTKHHGLECVRCVWGSNAARTRFWFSGVFFSLSIDLSRWCGTPRRQPLFKVFGQSLSWDNYYYIKGADPKNSGVKRAARKRCRW